MILITLIMLYFILLILDRQTLKYDTVKYMLPGGYEF